MGRTLRWLIRLRWCAIAGQLVTLVFVQLAFGGALPLASLALLIGVETVTNLAATIWISRLAGANEERWAAALLALDIVILTAMLHQTGGAENPFSFVYLVNIAVATVMLRARWTWALVALSLAGSAVLFLEHRPLPVAGMTHAEAMRIHLQGMWVAFGISAGLIVYFLLRLLREIASRDAELAAARERAERHERLGALATLAAGAAHELATPLSTIAVVARELERQSATAEAGLRDDVLLIRSEVERCRRILEGMSAEAGATAGEAPELVSLGTFVDEALGAPPESAGVSVAMDDDARSATLLCPRRALVQSLRNLVANAREADPDRRVRIVAEVAAAGARIEVRDRGQGMSADVLARLGEPFFTTKPPGRGMGLGLFLARTVVERIGGELSFDSTRGSGTVAVMTLPLAAP